VIDDRDALTSRVCLAPPEDLMDLKLFATVFGTVFLAELGDKTQLATLLFAAREDTNRVLVFAAASAALVATSALGVLAGGAVASWLDTRYLAWAAGAGFIVIGVWTIWNA
jgi:putative Ca2+/H+ antiporter (TMEM165/GDT1 family)